MGWGLLTKIRKPERKNEIKPSNKKVSFSRYDWCCRRSRYIKAYNEAVMIRLGLPTLRLSPPSPSGCPNISPPSSMQLMALLDASPSPYVSLSHPLAEPLIYCSVVESHGWRRADEIFYSSSDFHILAKSQIHSLDWANFIIPNLWNGMLPWKRNKVYRPVNLIIVRNGDSILPF